MVQLEASHSAAQENVRAACELFRALGTPNRLAIVLELDRGARCVHELVNQMGISQALASQHLRVLRTSGLVIGTRRGKEIVYSLADEHVAHIARDAVAHGHETIELPSHVAGDREEGLKKEDRW